MDVVTHALLGMAAACATTTARTRLRVRERLLLGASGGAFPDIDFAAFWIDPLSFLADWHQAPTHSIVLLPLWAVLIAAAFVGVSGRRICFAEAVWVGGLGLGTHIAADLVTAYGTAVFYPLSTMRLSLATTFVIDPLFTAIVLLGLWPSLRYARRFPAALALVALCLYVSSQAGLQQRAVDAGRASLQAAGMDGSRLVALAQPLSPFNWKLIAIDDELYREGYLNLVGHPTLVPALPGLQWLHDIGATYEPPERLIWRVRHRYGDRTEMRPLVERLWQDPRFAPFRRFAAYPAISRIHDDGRRICVWFTDLRYDLPVLPDNFRYGFCRDDVDAPWRLHRVRYFSERSTQRL